MVTILEVCFARVVLLIPKHICADSRALFCFSSVGGSPAHLESLFGHHFAASIKRYFSLLSTSASAFASHFFSSLVFCVFVTTLVLICSTLQCSCITYSYHHMQQQRKFKSLILFYSILISSDSFTSKSRKY